MESRTKGQPDRSDLTITANPPSSDGFVEAVEAIYETAAAPSRWPHALQKIADCYGDVGTVLMYRRDNGSLGSIVSPKLAAAQRGANGGTALLKVRHIGITFHRC